MCSCTLKGGARTVERLLTGTHASYGAGKLSVSLLGGQALNSTSISCFASLPPCLQNGFDGWLAKPFRVEEFARVMAACRTGAALTPQRKNI